MLRTKYIVKNVHAKYMILFDFNFLKRKTLAGLGIFVVLFFILITNYIFKL